METDLPVSPDVLLFVSEWITGIGIMTCTRWMSNFSYHTSIGLGVFIAAGTVALVRQD